MPNNAYKKAGYGWRSEYSIQSILVSLQDFLGPNYNYFCQDPNLVAQANKFRCHCCKHNGLTLTWPPFD